MRFVLILIFNVLFYVPCLSQIDINNCGLIDSSNLVNFSTVDVLDEENIKQLYTNEDLLSIKKGIEKIKCFLNTSDISFIEILDGWNKDVYDEIKKLLSHYQSPPQNLKYELISLKKIDSINIAFTLSFYFHVKQASFSSYQGNFQIKYNSKTEKLVIPFSESDNFKIIKTGDIVFFIGRNSSSIQNKTSFNLSAAYIDSLIKSISNHYKKFKKPQRDLSYVLADYFDLYQILGFSHYFGTSNYKRKLYTIFDAISDGFYKHELVHYVFAEYDFAYFINEGLATYLGKESKLNNNIISSYNKITSRLIKDDNYKKQIDTDSILLENADLSEEMYVISAILLWKYNQIKGPNAFYKSLFEKLLNLNDKEALVFLKSQLHISNLSKFLLEHKDPLLKFF